MTIQRKEFIGDQTLLLGDCLEVMPTLGPVDAVVTDPPYGVSLSKSSSRYNTVDAVKTYDDEEETVRELVLSAFDTWCANNTQRAVLTPGVRLLQDWPKANSIGTIFSPGAAGRDKWGFGCNNPILYYGTCPYTATGKGSRPNSFASYSANPYAEGKTEGHPCPKPLSWMLWLVTRASLEGHTILDPFMGSGTTLVACAKLGRKGIGIEIDPDYFEIACRRVEEAYRQPDLFVEPPKKAEQMGMDL